MRDNNGQLVPAEKTLFVAQYINVNDGSLEQFSSPLVPGSISALNRYNVDIGMAKLANQVPDSIIPARLTSQFDFIEGESIEVAGYPGDKTGLHRDTCVVKSSNVINLSNCDAAVGSSGSPTIVGMYDSGLLISGVVEGNHSRTNLTKHTIIIDSMLSQLFNEGQNAVDYNCIQIVTASDPLNVRSEPLLNAPVIAQAPKEVVLFQLDKINGFVEVVIGDHQETGFVSSKYTRPVVCPS